ncbi:MAG: bifunctional hydroxymethylpyrimidine kinase/phosphomethylpyrimidine kinase [Candidatus Aminicenantes bacterium]|nr:bifunctional hydroxymethylpyrimidine kinase/phosphomethylpyrimidine kinase [Candidatus Aminicenantes bacterium]
MKKILLSVAGYDPSSGAGVSLDLKVFDLLGFMGMAVLTSVTTQNSQRVESVHSLPPVFVSEQYQLLQEDFGISGIKVGMLGYKKNITPIDKICSQNQNIPVVIDPVFSSTSGKWLLKKDAIPRFIERISRKASLITPNCAEAALITGKEYVDLQNAPETGKEIYDRTRIPCLLTGLFHNQRVINFFYDGKDFYQIDLKKVSKQVHGTGCLLSASILCFLVQGHSLFESCQLGSEFTHQAIQKSVAVGTGQNFFAL